MTNTGILNLTPENFKLSPKYQVERRNTDTIFKLIKPTLDTSYLLKGEVYDEDKKEMVHLSVYENLRTQAAKTVTFKDGYLIVKPEDVQVLNFMINSPLNRDSPFRGSYGKRPHWYEVDNQLEELETERSYNVKSLAIRVIDTFTVSQAQHILKTHYGQNTDNVSKLITLKQMLESQITKDYFAFVRQHATEEDKLLVNIIHAHQTNSLKYHKGKWSLAANNEYIVTVGFDEYADEVLARFLTEPKSFQNPKDKEKHETLVAEISKIIGYSQVKEEKALEKVADEPKKK